MQKGLMDSEPLSVGITEDAVVGTNGKIELEHGCAETGERSIIENDVFQNRSTSHLGLVITAK
jgi:hypothetical protein